MVQEEQRAPDFTIPYGGGGEVALGILGAKRSYYSFILETTLQVVLPRPRILRGTNANFRPMELP